LYKPIDIDTLETNPSFRWWLTRVNFLNKDECAELRDYIDKNAKVTKGPYDRPEYSKYKPGMDLWKFYKNNPIVETKLEFENICTLNTTDIEEQKYLDKIWTLIKISNSTVYKYNISGIYKNKFMGHRYDNTQWYTPHADFHPIHPHTTIKLTLLIFLNNEGKDYQGGEFKFFDNTHIKAIEGRALIFPSFAGHEVKPVISGNRYSFITWAVGDTFV